MDHFLLLLKLKQVCGQNTLETLKTDSDSTLPLCGCGLLARSLMCLSLDFWFCTTGMNHSHCRCEDCRGHTGCAQDLLVKKSDEENGDDE